MSEFVPAWPAYEVRFLDAGAADSEPIRVQLRDGDVWRTEQQTGKSITDFNTGDPEFTLPATYHALRRMHHANLPPAFIDYVDLVDVALAPKLPVVESEGALGKGSDPDPSTGPSPASQ